MYEPPSEQGVDTTGYDVINKGSRSAGTIGTQSKRPRHSDRLTDQERPRTSTHFWRFTLFGNCTLVVRQTCLLGRSVEFTVPRELLADYPAGWQVQN